MMAQGVGRTDIGQRRDQNEDVFFVDNEQGIFVVCDGMGGHAAGELAARTAMETIREHFSEHRDQLDACRRGEQPIETLLTLAEQAVSRANVKVKELAQQELKYRGMGCALTMVVTAGYQAVMAHVGHTRLYLSRGGKFAQLSADHTMLAELVRAGATALAERRKSAHATSLTRSVGLQEAVVVDTMVVDLLPGDLLLLCSDGIFRDLDDPKILSASLTGDFDAMADVLVDEANTRGGSDNATAVVVRVLPEKDEEAPVELVAEVGHQLDLLSTVPLFSILPYAQLQRIRNLGRVVRLGQDDTLIAEGDVVERMYLVLQGKLHMEQDGEHLDVLREGDTIGELNLVCKRASAVAVVAAKPSTLLAIDRRSFKKLIHRRPWLGVALLEELFRLSCKRGIDWR